MQARFALQLSVEKKIGLRAVLDHRPDARRAAWPSDRARPAASRGCRSCRCTPAPGRCGRRARRRPRWTAASGRSRVSTQKTALWPAAIFGLRSPSTNAKLAVAVEDLELLGRAGQGVFQRGPREPHDAPILVHRQPLLLEELQHRRIENLDPAVGQDVDASPRGFARSLHRRGRPVGQVPWLVSP